MAATSTVICNLALNRMGQPSIDSISGTDVLSQKCNLIYNQMLEELLSDGPELGWKFTLKRYHGIDDQSTSITAFADYSGTVAGTVSVTSTAHGLITGDMVEISGTTSYNNTYDVTKIDANTYYITATWVADDATGTSRWTSEQYEYRYALPTAHRITHVQVGGVDITDWTREGIYVLTNQESSEVDIYYIDKITDTTLFPPQFTKCLVIKIAIQLHYNLTQDLKAIQILEYDLDKAMSKAMAMDEREKYVQEESFSWVNVGHTTDTLETVTGSSTIGGANGGWVYQY